MGESKDIDMLNMTKDRKMLHSHKTSVHFVVPSQDVLNREVKKVVATQYAPTLLCARIAHFQPCTITQSSERISGQKLSISYLPGY